MRTRRTPAPIRAIVALFKAAFLMVRAAFAVALGAAVLGGLPWALVRFAGWPLPHHMLSLSQLKTDLTSPILGDQFYLNAIAIVLWFLWSILAFSFLLELLYAIRRIPAPHVPGLGPAQLLAGFLITAIGVTALLGRSAAPARADTSTVVPKVRTAATAPVLLSTSTGLRSTSTTPARESVHHVVPGDSLYKIAAEDLGNGEDWPALFKLNAGVEQHDGQRLTNPDLILPGWDITIPGAATTPTNATPVPTAPEPSAPATPTPAAPSATSTPHAGPSADNSAPTAPAGSAPSVSQTTPAVPAPSTNQGHAAAPAHRAGADSGLWIELAGGSVIAASTLLALRAAASRRHKLRSLWANPYWPRPGETTALDTPQMPPALRPARTITLTPGGPKGPQSTSDLADIGELDAFGAPVDRAAPTDDQEALTAASPAVPDDLQASLGHAMASPPDLSAILEAGEAGRDGVWIPVAVDADGELIGLGDLYPGLGMTGPGALGAARAIAATVLSTRSPEQYGSKLLIPRADAALLLDVPETDLDRLSQDVRHLMIVDDLREAVAVLGEFAAARTTALAEYQVPDFEALVQIDDLLDDPEPMVLLAVVRGVPDEHTKAVLDQPKELRLHSVLLGAHPAGATWRVDADGEVISGITGDGVHAFDLSAAGLHSALDVTAGVRERPQIVPPDPHAPLAETPSAASADNEPHAHPDSLAITADPTPSTADEPVLAPAPDDTMALASRTPQGVGAIRLVVAPPDNAESDEAAEVCEQVPGRVDEDAAHERTAGAPREIAALADQPPTPPMSPAPPRLALVPPTYTAVEDGAGIAAVEQILADFTGRAAQIRVLGPLTVHTASGQVSTKVRGGGWKIAARLALHHSRGQSLEELAELWPDLDGQKLSDARKNDLKSLRGALKRDVLAGTGTGARAEFIPRHSGRFRLSPQFVAVDLACFDQLRAIAARAGSVPVRIAAAEAALGLYEGDLLTGMDEEWVIAPRVAVRRDALATATLLAQLAADAGDHEQALAWWERARGIDDNEEVYRQIMKTQARLGRRADISATKALLEAKLDVLGEAPSPVTYALLGELLSGRTPILPRTPGP
ncbi:MAG: BTAD domain-containing putative transcriptional regulator [Catenulispora sp.]